MSFDGANRLQLFIGEYVGYARVPLLEAAMRMGDTFSAGATRMLFGIAT